MRRSTLDELVDRDGLPTPTLMPGSGFGAFMDLYRAASAVLRGPEDLRRLVREVAEDAVADGAVWVEVHFDTTLTGDTRGHVGRPGALPGVGR